jgi:excisionase family DNA binding protein
MPTRTSADRLPLMDLPAVAERLGVNQRHIRRLVAERRIPYLKWGHLLRFDPAEIEVWLDNARRSGPAEVPSRAASLVSTDRPHGSVSGRAERAGALLEEH